MHPRSYSAQEKLSRIFFKRGDVPKTQELQSGAPRGGEPQWRVGSEFLRFGKGGKGCGEGGVALLAQAKQVRVDAGGELVVDGEGCSVERTHRGGETDGRD